MLLLSSCFHRYKQSGDIPELISINVIDRNGISETITNQDRLTKYDHVDFLQPQPYQKVLRVFERDRAGQMRAEITSYHPNGQIRQYLEVINSRACGAYKEWHSNGTLKVEAAVVNGTPDIGPTAEASWLFDGCCQSWNESGNLLATIYYNKGELEGVSTYYHLNGNTWKLVPFREGKIEGDFQVFTEDGCLTQQTHYTQGVMNGAALRYWKGDLLAAKELFREGKLLEGDYFDKNQVAIAQIREGKGFRVLFGKEGVSEIQEYRLGEPGGVVKVFRSNGTLSETYNLQHGVKHGEEIDYDPQTNKPMLSLNWHEGKIQGIVKTWYPNGVLESQREMSENSKNGISTAWYLDGSLMLIEEYDHDRLVKGEYFMRGEKFPTSEVREGKGTATLYNPEGNFLRRVAYRNGQPSD